VARGRGDLGARAAHDARETDWAGVVGDEQVFGVEGALMIVERREALTLRRAAHSDAAGDPVEVVEVQRLAEFDHDVVRDVDRERDRADAGKREARDHPGGRWSFWVNAANNRGCKQAASRAVVNW